ncbi:S1 family peptidase, partial [Streptomyces fradiae]
MRRTTTLRTALSTALLLATAALGFTPASAATATGSAAPAASAVSARSSDSPAPAASRLSPGLLTALGRDLGLTEAAAADRLRAESAARAVEAPARRAAG